MRKKLLANESNRGVSPVIGVILMVAITVILAAVIGTMVLNMTDEVQDNGPTAQLQSSDATPTVDAVADGASADLITIDHKGGSTVSDGEYIVRIKAPSDTSFHQITSSTTHTVGSGDVSTSTLSAFSVGDQIVISLDDGSSDGSPEDYTGAYELQLIHNPSNSILVDTTVSVN